MINRTTRSEGRKWGWSNRQDLDQAMGFPGGSDGKESACNAGDVGSIPGLGRSHGKGNGCCTAETQHCKTIILQFKK